MKLRKKIRNFVLYKVFKMKEKEDRGEPTLYERIKSFIKYKIFRCKKPYIAYRMGMVYVDWRVPVSDFYKQ